MKRVLITIIIVLLFPSILICGLIESKETVSSFQANSLESNEESTPQIYDVKFYHIDLEVSNNHSNISGNTSILIELLDAGAEELVFDAASTLDISQIQINGTTADYQHQRNQLIIPLDGSFSMGSLINIRVEYTAGNYSGGTRGVYNAVDRNYGHGVTWTLSEPYSSRNWFPCKQELTDKADSVYVFITTEAGLRAGSNGLLTAEVSLPGNRVRYEWKSRYPIAYYLISFSVSDYVDYSIYARINEQGDSLLIQNFIYDHPSFLANNKQNIDNTVAMVELFSDLFGPYPFSQEKYGHCIVPSGGGMEHQTMTTLVNFSFNLVSHELAHQWFGDYITCGSWQDIWVNEGFASYAEYIALQYLVSQDNADSWMREAHQYSKSRNTGSIYVPENMLDDEGRIFDFRLSYKKGAVIIHMIRHEVGDDDLFFEILRTFVENYRNGTALGIDFKSHLEISTGKDFTDFFNQWYFGEGYPEMSFNWFQRNDTLYITSFQTTTGSTPYFNVLTDFLVTIDGKDTLVSARQNSNYDTLHFPVAGKVERLIVDPYNWLLAEITGVSNREDLLFGDASVRVKPNPASREVVIEVDGPGQTYRLSLVDSTGRILHTAELDSPVYRMDIQGYPEGMYNIVLTDDKNHLYPVKLVKI